MVRDLTMLGSERPADVFDAAMALFIKHYELTVHQRLTRALAMGGIETDEKPSQWMARFRQVGDDWTREDVERWALLRRLPSSLRTTLEIPTPQLSMNELLRKADELYVTLPDVAVSHISDVPSELVTAIFACDVPAVNALFRARVTDKIVGGKKRPKANDVFISRSNRSQQCWYHFKFSDDAR